MGQKRPNPVMNTFLLFQSSRLGKSERVIANDGTSASGNEAEASTTDRANERVAQANR